MEKHKIRICFRALFPSLKKTCWYLMLSSLGFILPLSAQDQNNKYEEGAKKKLDLSYIEIDTDDYNGSAYRISGEQIRNLPVSNLGNAINGLVPGFFSRQKSGGIVNESPSYWIRGIHTASASEGVLVLVDGQERDFGSLSPYEIEDIIVLKDAAATVLYGMRAANGAILVNTRQGNVSKPQIELTVQMINQKPFGQLKRLNSLGYATNYNAAQINDAAAPSYSDHYLSQYRNGANNELYPDIDWLGDLMQSSSWMQRYNLNLHGGTKKIRYFINAGLLTQNGFFKTDDENKYSTNNNADRFNIRSNVEFDLTSTTLFSLDLYGLNETQNRPANNSSGLYNSLLSTPPNSFPYYYSDNGNYIDDKGNAVSSHNGKIIAGNGISSNPWATLNRAGYGTYRATYGSFRTKAFQNLDVITKGLSAAVTFSMDSYTQAVTNRSKEFAYYQMTENTLNSNVLTIGGADGTMQNTIGSKSSERRTTIEAQVSWNRSFDKHNISTSAFYNQYEQADEVTIPQRFQSLNGWAGYNYDKRYGVDFLMSYSGAYKFEKGNRFGFFPTVAAGWTVSNESFFAGVKDWFSFLKLRGSFGMIGNYRGVDDFAYIGSLSNVAGTYNVGNSMSGVPGYTESIIANPTVIWEEVKLSNVGLDARLFGNRLALTAEYFYDDRTGIYMANNRVSSLYGYDASISENLGEMHSQGVDVSLNWNDKIGDFGYSLGGTFSYADNVLTANGQADQPYSWLYDTGYSRGTKKGYIAEGFFNSYEEIAAAPYQTFGDVHPGDVRYKDINADGLIDSNDQVPIGYADVPKLYYSGMLGLSYKGFSLSTVFVGASKFSRNINNIKVAYPFYENGTIYEHQLNYWTPENPNAEYPRISLNNTSGNNVQNSTIWVKDVWFLRLNTIQLAYELPERLFDKTFISGLQLFANAYNVYTWSNLDVVDPMADETASSMPLTRNINFGFSLRF